MTKTQSDILNYMNQRFNDEFDQLDAFFSLIGTVFSNVQPTVPGIKNSVESMLRSNPSLSFSSGFLIFTQCLDIGKVFLAPVHMPPPAPFILTQLSSNNPTNAEVSTHIASLIQSWIATGATPAASPTVPLILI